jgi:hypothetical protein
MDQIATRIAAIAVAAIRLKRKFVYATVEDGGYVRPTAQDRTCLP